MTGRRCNRMGDVTPYSVLMGEKKNTPKAKARRVDSWMEISCAVCPGFALPGARGRARGADDESCIQKNSRLRMGEFGRRGPETWAAFDIHFWPQPSGQTHYGVACKYLP